MQTSTTVGIESLFKRQVIRTADAKGHITVTGGKWECRMTDGRTFVHGDKAMVRRCAAAYSRGGEAALAEMCQAQA